MLNNRTCYHDHDLIPTSEGPTCIHHGKKSETTIQWCSSENSFQTIYLTFVERYKILTTFVVETCLFLKACFLSCLFWRVLTFFWHMLTFAIRRFWLISGVLTFAKYVKFLKRSLVQADLSIIFLIFQPKDMLNLGLNFPNLSLYLLINVMLIKKNVIRKN